MLLYKFIRGTPTTLFLEGFIYQKGIIMVLVRYRMQTLEARIYADKQLFQKIKKKHPEMEKMSQTAITHLALTKLTEA